MAGPKVHTVPTVILFGVSLVVYTPLAILSQNSLSAVLILFLGVLVDMDHLSLRRIKKILQGDKGPVPGWVNWMHTWTALIVVGCFTLICGFYLSFASYLLHVLIDGGDIDNAGQSGIAPVPEFIHGFYPKSLKYKTGIII